MSYDYQKKEKELKKMASAKQNVELTIQKFKMELSGIAATDFGQQVKQQSSQHDFDSNIS